MGGFSSSPSRELGSLPFEDGLRPGDDDLVGLLEQNDLTWPGSIRPNATFPAARLHALPRLTGLANVHESEYAKATLLTEQLPGLANLPFPDLRETGLCRAAGPGTEVAGALAGNCYSEGLRTALRSSVAVAARIHIRTRKGSLPIAPL
jgi:hypothetical protein